MDLQEMLDAVEAKLEEQGRIVDDRLLQKQKDLTRLINEAREE